MITTTTILLADYEGFWGMGTMPMSGGNMALKLRTFLCYAWMTQEHLPVTINEKAWVSEVA